MKNVPAGRVLEAALLVLVCGAVTAVYASFQPPILAGEGRGWDGKSYLALYERFRFDRSEPIVQFPFCQRVGLPYLASLLPLEPAAAFKTWNVSAGFVATLVTYATLRLSVAAPVALVATLPLLFGLFGPLRFPFFYPYYVDPPAMLCYALAAFAVAKRWYPAALLLIIASGVFREAGTYLAVVFLLALLVYRQMTGRQALIALAAIAGGATLLAWIRATPCDGGLSELILPNIVGPYGKFDSYTGVLRVAAAFSMTLGPFVLTRTSHQPGRQTEVTHSIALAFLLTSMLMASAGGSDTTRLLAVTYPLYAYWLADRVAHVRVPILFVLGVAGMLANSFAKRIPEPAAYAPNHDVTGYFALSPDFAHVGIAAGLLIFWWLVALAIRRLEDRLSPPRVPTSHLTPER